MVKDNWLEEYERSERRLLIGILIVIGGMIGVAIFIGIDLSFEDYDKVCEAHGYKEYIFINGQQYCLDKNNEAHFARFECKGWYWDKKCRLDIITIGDVRTIPKGDKK